jgi:hypothetical protein
LWQILSKAARLEAGITIITPLAAPSFPARNLSCPHGSGRRRQIKAAPVDTIPKPPCCFSALFSRVTLFLAKSMALLEQCTGMKTSMSDLSHQYHT